MKKTYKLRTKLINLKTLSKALSYFLQFNNPWKNIPLNIPCKKEKKLKIPLELKNKTYALLKTCR